MSELGLAASQREIGAMVARLFEDIRGETKRTIETKLGRASMATGLPAVSDTGETRILQSGTGDRRRRRLATIIGVSVGAVALIGVAAARLTAERTAVESVAPAAPPPRRPRCPRPPQRRPHRRPA